MAGSRTPSRAIYVDSIRLGNELSRGGCVVHRLVGCACEADAFIQLGRLVPTLEPKEARWLIAELEKIDSATVTWDEVRRNECRFHHEQPREEPELAKVSYEAVGISPGIASG